MIRVSQDIDVGGGRSLPPLFWWGKSTLVPLPPRIDRKFSVVAIISQLDSVLDFSIFGIFPKFEDDMRRGHAAWLDWPWKLHRIEKDRKITLELYNLVADPGEEMNVSAKHPAKVANMKTALEAWQDEVLRSWEGADYKQDDAANP